MILSWLALMAVIIWRDAVSSTVFGAVGSAWTGAISKLLTNASSQYRDNFVLARCKHLNMVSIPFITLCLLETVPDSKASRVFPRYWRD
jgi:hypothetical protein